MRPQQQNRRMRGRGNNNGGGNNNSNNNNVNNQNRRGPNPLTRNYESNGPDVKIRGSAQQIADKYTTLARDAQSAGDRVVGENYLQHAEHYNRIIAAAQAQMPTQQQQRTDNDDDGEDERDDGDQAVQQDQVRGQDRSRQQDQSRSHDSRPYETRPIDMSRPRPANDGSGPQPVIEGMPAEVALEQAALNGANGHRPPQPANPGDNPGNGASAAADGESGEDMPPRKSRRPRRSNRNRGEAGEAVGSDDPAVETSKAEPAFEPAASGQD